MAQITLRDYLQQTEDAIRADRAEDALARCQHMLTYFPEALEPQRLLGEIYLAQNNVEKARHAFDWVLTSDPEHVVAYCDRALISERIADYDTALDCYQQAYELSRGNSQIRSQFNEISAKAGQQGFMFSRAGLARLYMRGDLLSQAVQEWDAVLAVNPERLDARTGLLETYWREGLYDRVEQLATQILEDAPTCLKALLLLAHVVSAKNMQRSQELLEQARTLDPDLVMAQVLFADMFATQPADSFLQLLKQPPAQLLLPETETYTPPAFANDPLRKEPDSVPAPSLLHREPDVVPNRDLSTWGILGTWDNEGDPSMPQTASDASSHDNLELPVWSPSSILGPDIRSRQNFSEPASQFSAELARSEIRQTPDNPLELQPSLSERSNFESEPPIGDAEAQTIAQGQPLGGKTTWEELDSQARSDLAGVDLWKSESAVDELTSLSGTWSFSPSASDTPAPPSWLNMLTQQDRLQMSGALPSVPSPEQQEVAQRDKAIMPASLESSAPAQLTSSVAPTQLANAAPPVQPVNSVAPAQPPDAPAPIQPVKPSVPVQPPAPAQPSQDVKPLHSGGKAPLEEEESFFGPAWLKSQGAYSLAPETLQEPASSSPAAETPSVPPVQKFPVSQAHPTQLADSTNVNNAATEEELKLLSTLEEIDQDLRSQGFVSLEPNTLASIAQKDVAGSSSNTLETEQATNAPEKPYQDVNLSSALAELGNLRSQTPTSPDIPNEADMRIVAATPAQAQEPEWMAALRSFHAPQDAQPPESSETLPPAATAESQEPQQSEEPYWMAPMQPEPSPAALQPQKAEKPDWMAVLQSEPTPTAQPPQQPEEPYWMTPMQSEPSPFTQQPQKAEESDWMAALQSEPTPTAQPPQQSEEPYWMTPMQSEPTPAIQQLPQADEPYWMVPMQAEQQQEVQESQQPVKPNWMDATLYGEKEITHKVQEARKSQVSNDLPAIARINETPQPVRTPDARPNRIPITAGSVFEPIAQSMPADTDQLSRPLSAPHSEPLLDNELETTMRRPAVRLQHLQQSRTTAQHNPSSRGQTVERSMGKAAEGQINYKDYLVRGYQHQLSGDYDEAMQAYRIIIKGSPELLSEVVSNVRALLKLAPKYSAGYRVLGDAYMRQGEYLQAMEAYNKALTMAKKARS